ncbi:anaphase-promoting complex subunit 4 [Procambarus clarkii]|uniref:anaphase-promoting complex subunit 4 n=1 Tax=Procambarus clarkii TaxID=6728 RepID=UPI001E673481|nr:anaphase-promoting complex subunit 4-like [Procambarus clarkii]
MAATCIMKQVEERHVATEITRCVWSPKMDLVAVANVQGQVAMHRLSWQRVWVISSPGENVKVTGLAWRPDSKVLAVGYSTGEVILVDIEDSSLVHKLNANAEVTALNWAVHVPEEASKKETLFEDSSEMFLPPLPSLSKTYTGSSGEDREEGWHEGCLLRDQTSLTLLTVATAAASVYIYAFGLFHCATVNLADSVPRAGQVLDATPSHDLHLLSCLVERDIGGEREVVHVTIETLILACRHQELRALAYRYGQICGLMTYASHTLTLLAEAWENILLELDLKLATYARTVPEGGVSADFLDLLVFGLSSTEFDMFLSNQLTEKGLKKLGHSIELSYSNIQKLVLRNVQAVGQALVYQLSALVGLARHHDRFGMLGVEEDVVTNAVREAGAFVLKAVELQQVIDSAMSTFKAFLRWLYVVVQRVRGETVPDEMSRMTQQDLTYITEFLHDSLEDTETGPDGEKRTRFRLERVGQYLKDAPLSCPPESGRNPWAVFLAEHPAVAEHSLIFPHYPERSLLQEHKNLERVLDNMAGQPAKVISGAVNIVAWVPFMAVAPTGPVSVSQISCPRNNAMYTVLIPGPKQTILYLARWPTSAERLAQANAPPGPAHHVEAAPFVFSRLEGTRGCSSEQLGPPSPFLHLIGAQFYAEDTLSVLAQDPADSKSSFFIQLWMQTACGGLKPLAVYGGRRLAEAGVTPQDACRLVDASGYRRLEGGPLSSLAVSGSRKVALLLSENRRRVRLFEMEVDEDDEDDDEDDTAQHESIMNASGASDDQVDNL